MGDRSTAGPARRATALAGLLGLTLVAHAAGPEWVEDDNGGADAGVTPKTAQPTVGEGPLSKIRGKLDSLEAVPFGGIEDFDDVYLIRIDDPEAFLASTAVSGSFSEFDSALYLFDAAGFGLLGNVTPPDPPEGDGFDGATLLNAATDRTGLVLEEPGLYLLGITVTPRMPFSGGGSIFFFEEAQEISGPDGPGAGGVLAGWESDALLSGAGGDYEITLAGVTFAITPGACCFADGSCQDLDPDDCGMVGGAHQGEGTGCASTACPLPVRTGSASEKGSLLVFSSVEVRWDAAGHVVRDTFLTLNNDYPADVDIQLYFVNGDPPLPASGGERAHPGWNWMDNAFTLTQNQPTYFSCATGLPFGTSPLEVLDPGPPPGRPAGDGTGDRVLRGFVYAWAIDGDGAEIRWNHLAGESTVVDYQGTAAWSATAYSFAVVDPGVPNGGPLGSPGELRLNGTEYAAVHGMLLLDFYADGAMAFSGGDPFQIVTTATELVLHPVSADLRQESGGPVCTKADVDIWNMEEFKFSGTHRCVCCWDRASIADYDPPNNFLVDTLQTTKGRARIEGQASGLCADGPSPSRYAAMLGVAVRHVSFQFDLSRSTTAVNLPGRGIESAVIRYDPLGPPPESTLPAAEAGR